MRTKVQLIRSLAGLSVLAFSVPLADPANAEPSARPAPGIAATVLARQEANLRGIESITFSSKDVFQGPTEPQGRSAGEAQEVRQRYTISGERFRVETTIRDSTDATKWVYAWDGTRSQHLVGGEKPVLVTGSEVMGVLFGVNPFTFTYSFASEELPFSCLQRHSTWEKLAAEVKSVKDATVLGHPGVLIDFHSTRFAGITSNEVFFASDMGYFPLQIKQRFVAPDAKVMGGVSESYLKGHGLLTVTDVKEIRSPAGVLRIPVRVEGTYFDSEGNVVERSRSEMEAATLRVNEPVPDDVFRIPAPPDAHPRAAPQPPVPLGEPAPDITVTCLDGRHLKLSSLRGKTVLLIFWATSCGHCRVSLPEVQKIQDEFASRDLAVVACSSEGRPVVERFVAGNGYRFPVYLVGKQVASTAYNVRGVPTFAIVDSGGRLRAYLVGEQKPGALREHLRKLGIISTEGAATP